MDPAWLKSQGRGGFLLKYKAATQVPRKVWVSAAWAERHEELFHILARAAHGRADEQAHAHPGSTGPQGRGAGGLKPAFPGQRCALATAGGRRAPLARQLRGTHSDPRRSTNLARFAK